MADQNDQGTASPGATAPSEHPADRALDDGPIPLPATNSSTVPVAAEPAPAMLQRLDVLLLGLVLVLAFLVGSFAATNSDVWLHLASGRQIAQGQWTIGVDPFSLATEATPDHPAVDWVQQSWLYSLLFYTLYNVVGGAGLVVLKALAIVALASCLLCIPGDRKHRFLAVIYVGLAVLAVSPQVLLRPMTVSFLFFAVTLLLCYRAGALGNVPARPRLLWWLPLLFLVWANLDAWFIMGPLVLALLWAGSGLGLLLGIRPTFPGKTLGAVLGAGLLACVVNPHHVRVFLLPPELAYPLLRVLDLPDLLGAGGRALVNLRHADPEYYPLISPLSVDYWGSTAFAAGLNVAGLSFWVLFVLGLISIVVNAVVTKKPGAPGLHPGRFMLWAFLAFLSLLQIRLIPWFVLASAPLTLLNLVDWRTWLANIQVPNWRPALAARVVALVIVVFVLFLAWPGWLIAPWGDMSSSRRVAWSMPVDRSQQGAALRLAALNKDGKSVRVFNFGPETAHYCAWFAPGVKCLLDIRWPLFADTAGRFAVARKAIYTNVPEGWQKLFLDQHVDYVSIPINFLKKRDADLIAHLWLNEAHWSQQYADGRTAIFAWSGPDRRFPDDLRAELKQRAFGPVPEKERAPAQVPALPQEEPSFWSQYSEGLAAAPLACAEASLWLRYHQVMGTSWQNSFFLVSQIARGAEPALGVYSATLPYTIVTMGAIPTKVYSMQFKTNNKFILRSRDFGPPAAPLLMIRAARRGVVDNPQSPRVYRTLWEAYEVLKDRQEDYWANYRGDARFTTGLRNLLRQVQIITAFRTYLDLKPDDPEVHEMAAQLFYQLDMYDVALTHLQQAAANFDQYRPDASNPTAVEFFRSKKASLEKGVQSLGDDVRKRREDYALAAASKPVLEKFKVAMANKLAQEAVDLLASAKMETLRPEEKEIRDRAVTNLLLLMGRASYLTEGLKGVAGLTELRALHAAALGNYADLDRVLDEMEKQHTATRTRALAEIVTSQAVVLAGPGPVLTDPVSLYIRTYLYALHLDGTFKLVARPEAELRALRGIMALEQGDTAAARHHLEGALQIAGPDNYFQDRIIAERYLELLRDTLAATR